jgi:hypothetical protein
MAKKVEYQKQLVRFRTRVTYVEQLGTRIRAPTAYKVLAPDIYLATT